MRLAGLGQGLAERLQGEQERVVDPGMHGVGDAGPKPRIDLDQFGGVIGRAGPAEISLQSAGPAGGLDEALHGRLERGGQHGLTQGAGAVMRRVLFQIAIGGEGEDMLAIGHRRDAVILAGHERLQQLRALAMGQLVVQRLGGFHHQHAAPAIALRRLDD